MDEVIGNPLLTAEMDRIRVLTLGLPSVAVRMVANVLDRLGLTPELVDGLTPSQFSTVPTRTMLIASTLSLLKCLDRTPALLPAIASTVPVLGIGLPPNVGEAVRLMRAGVRNMVQEEFDLVEIEEFVREAAHAAIAAHELKTTLESDRRRLSMLTDQEFDMFTLLMAGLTNKEIAGRLQVGLRTVEGRRQQIMKKTNSRSFAELIRLGVRVAYPYNAHTAFLALSQTPHVTPPLHPHCEIPLGNTCVTPDTTF